MEIPAFIHDRVRSSGHPETEIRRLYVLEGLLRRLFSHPDAQNVVVRGSLATSVWLRPFPRPVQDIDLMAERHDPAEWGKNFVTRALKLEMAEDRLQILHADILAEATWINTELPGMRFQVPVQLGEQVETVQIDFSAWDTLALPPRWMDFPALQPNTDFPVHTVVPEQAVAWKMHGLFEFWDTSGTWRIKDLYDLVSIFNSVSLDRNLILKALREAFRDRSTPPEICLRFLEGNFGKSSGSRKHWKQFVKSTGRELAVQSLGELMSQAHRYLDPVFEEFSAN